MPERRVLIIDDDQVDRLVYERNLATKDGQTEILSAGSIDSGLQMFRSGKFDCVILDYNLPAGDGLSVLDQIGEIDPACPIIMMTGLGDEEVAVSAMKRGAADYLIKGSHTAAELRRTVNGIIENAKLKRELDVANERMHTVLDTVTSGIIALSREAEIMLINPAARHMLGGASEAVPFPWPSHVRFLDGEDLRPLDASLSPINRALVGQRLYEEINILTRTTAGPSRYVRVSSSLVDDVDSKIRVVLVLDDVTEAVTQREQVDRASRLDALGQLTGGVAHDFNNLLGTLLYAIELAALDRQSERVQRALDIAKKSIHRGTNLTSRLLAFAKHQPNLESARPVADVITDLVAIASPTIEDNITLTAELPDRSLLAVCDQAQLENAILNLILNARDAIVRTGRGGTILIRGREYVEIDAETTHVEADSTYVRTTRRRNTAPDRADDGSVRFVEISVTDDGSGMNEEVRRRSIDPFFTTKDTTSGTGLGLSMVYGFIQQSEGELVIRSDAGQGTSVQLLLPKRELASEPELVVEETEIPRGDGQTILIVEDEANLRGVMHEMLDALGYRSISASSSAEALRILSENVSFDLLLTDIVLPGGTGGFELARLFRERHPDLPIIYMSGYTGFTEEEMGDVKAPMIAKPCRPADLASTIKNMFGQA